MLEKTLKRIEWAGCLAGLLGALILSLNMPFSGIGFGFFLISNIFWIAYAVGRRAVGLLVMQLGFMTTRIIGIVRWLV